MIGTRLPRSRSRKLVGWILTLVCIVLLSPYSMADEIRVVDSRGLIRAVKITRGASRAVVTLEAPAGRIPSGECSATNVDGLAAEKRVRVSGAGECVFIDITAGSWQILVPEGFRWRVKLYE